MAEGATDTSVPDITPLQRRLILVTTLTGLGTVSFLITVLSIAQVEIGGAIGPDLLAVGVDESVDA